MGKNSLRTIRKDLKVLTVEVTEVYVFMFVMTSCRFGVSKDTCVYFKVSYAGAI